MFPNLIVIGALKCGTTSLHAYLDLHPEISMSAEKELGFFVAEKNWHRGRDWYESQFPVDTPVRGESSPAYTAHPIFSGVPERISRLLADTRLIYLVRDPIDRMIAHYLWHHASPHPTPGSFAEALDDPRYVMLSRYWLQLEQYLACFPADRILVVDSDELDRRREHAMSRIFRFLGVDTSYRSPQLQVRHNVSGRVTRRNRAGRLTLSLLHRAIGSERTAELGARVPEAFKAPFRATVERPVGDAALRERLVHLFEEDVERLRAHTGLAFDGWSL